MLYVKKDRSPEILLHVYFSSICMVSRKLIIPIDVFICKILSQGITTQGSNAAAFPDGEICQPSAVRWDRSSRRMK